MAHHHQDDLVQREVGVGVVAVNLADDGDDDDVVARLPTGVVAEAVGADDGVVRRPEEDRLPPRRLLPQPRPLPGQSLRPAHGSG